MKRLKSEREHGQSVTVLDMCSGKGGDFLKWKKGGVTKVVCSGKSLFLLTEMVKKDKNSCSVKEEY